MNVSPPEEWLMVSAGGAHTCAPDIANVVWCWGDNSQGQIGQGDLTDRDRPHFVCFE